MKRIFTGLSLLISMASYAATEGLFIETEYFNDKGGWITDAQFIDQMGSPYLMAHGMGKPVADAQTTVEFQKKEPTLPG